MAQVKATNLVITLNELRRLKKYPVKHKYSFKERSNLAELLKVCSLTKLHFDGIIVQNSDQTYTFSANVNALVIQNCIVTLYPVKTSLNFGIKRHYSKNSPKTHSKKVITNILDNHLEFFGKTLNISDVIVEALSLEIPDYPRRKNIKFNGVSATKKGVTPLRSISESPFYALKDLLR